MTAREIAKTPLTIAKSLLWIGVLNHTGLVASASALVLPEYGEAVSVGGGFHVAHLPSQRRTRSETHRGCGLGRQKPEEDVRCQGLGPIGVERCHRNQQAVIDRSVKRIERNLKIDFRA
jgi:hypothetical protein